MAVSMQRFVFTQNYTLPAGTVAPVVAGEPATGGAAGFGNSATAAGQAGALWPTTYLAGTAIVLDGGTPSALYTALNTAGVIRAYVQGTDDRGGAALAN
jgi:hypothetical protein